MMMMVKVMLIALQLLNGCRYRRCRTTQYNPNISRRNPVLHQAQKLAIA